MRKILIIVALAAAGLAGYVAADRVKFPLYEWCRLLIAPSLIYTGLHFRRAGSSLLLFAFMILLAPVISDTLIANMTLGINHVTSCSAIAAASIYIGHIMRREFENARMTDLLRAVMDDVEEGAGEETLYDALRKLFQSHLGVEAIDIYFFGSDGLLRGRGEEEPLGADHLYYRVAEAGECLFSRIAAEDERILLPEDDGVCEKTERLVVFPVSFGGAAKAVLACVNPPASSVNKDAVEFLNAAARIYENALELTLNRRAAIAHEAQSLRIKSMFSSYVSRAVAEEILKDPDSVELGGATREVTVMFTEIKNFPELMKRYGPVELASILNGHVGDAVECVIELDGTIDKYIDSGVMAFWGAPLAQADSAARAIQCAIRLRQKTEAMNARREAAGLPMIDVRVGINTGPVVAGNIGSMRRMEYTVIGDAVNLASRIKSVAGNQSAAALASESTRAAAGDAFRFGEELSVAVKGKSEPVKAYALMDG